MLTMLGRSHYMMELCLLPAHVSKAALRPLSRFVIRRSSGETMAMIQRDFSMLERSEIRRVIGQDRAINVTLRCFHDGDHPLRSFCTPPLAHVTIASLIRRGFITLALIGFKQITEDIRDEAASENPVSCTSSRYNSDLRRHRLRNHDNGTPVAGRNILIFFHECWSRCGSAT